MSKAYIAKRLVELGCPKAVNTLRRYPREQLDAMLAAAERDAADHAGEALDRSPVLATETALQSPVEVAVHGSELEVLTTMIAPQVPSDESIKPMPVPTAQRAGSKRAWLALAMLPLDVLRAIVGTTPLCMLGF